MPITIVRRGVAPAPEPIVKECEATAATSGAAGRNGAEYKRRSAQLIANRLLMAKLARQPRLTVDEEQAAIRRFKATRGITRYPAAFAAPTQAFIR
ncbi:hypothetical protein [Reyranella sp.]|uniref:hypothetical protein n=1 Tax=Reyranella sp. TaxID=1929291 RepID=UPI0011F76589|nr:hypothetical protein [Reyranella sp.]TAJ84521.1 MAG: hypothetical protein EPO50_17670 [Reyranella sp.]